MPQINTLTVTDQLNEIDFSRSIRHDLMVECAFVEKFDIMYFAVDSDSNFMNHEQTAQVLADYVTETEKAFA